MCKRKVNYFNGYIFRYHKESLGDCRTARGKQINQLTLDGEFIKTWNGCTEAARHFKCDPSTISRVCRGLNKTAKNFKWIYK